MPALLGDNQYPPVHRFPFQSLILTANAGKRESKETLAIKAVYRFTRVAALGDMTWFSIRVF